MMATSTSAFTARSSSSSSSLGRYTGPGVLRPSFQPVGIRSCPGGVTMLFGNLFGGGASAQKIDYSTLDFPGPEIATATQVGKVLVTSPAKPDLAVATFSWPPPTLLSFKVNVKWTRKWWAITLLKLGTSYFLPNMASSKFFQSILNIIPCIPLDRILVSRPRNMSPEIPDSATTLATTCG
jgi:hypothetical protein